MCGSKFHRPAGSRALYCARICKYRHNEKRRAYFAYLRDQALLIAQGAPRPDCRLFNADIEMAAQKYGILLPEVKI